MGLIGEFKDFAMRGNVLDMAVGIIIGGAFGTIVKSMVSDVIMPPIGMALGNVDFSKLKLVLQEGTAAVTDAEGAVTTPEVAEVAINYGTFINNVVSFIIVAFCVFILVKAVNTATKKLEKEQEEAPAAPPEPSAEEKLLAEIRDVLKAKA